MKIHSLRYLARVFLLIFFISAGCDNDGGDSCIDPSQFFNGASAQTQISEWDCVANGFNFSFAIFEDGTGATNALDIGFFQFLVGCKTVDFVSATSFGTLTFQGQVEGGVELGVASFIDVLVEIDGEELGIFNISCILDLVPEDTLLL